MSLLYEPRAVNANRRRPPLPDRRNHGPETTAPKPQAETTALKPQAETAALKPQAETAAPKPGHRNQDAKT